MARRLTTNQEIAGSIPASINIISSKEQFIFCYLPSCISKFVFGLCLKYYLDIAKKKIGVSGLLTVGPSRPTIQNKQAPTLVSVYFHLRAMILEH
jgi:hypothetical protein